MHYNFYICSQVDEQLTLAIIQFFQTKGSFACALSMSAPIDGSECLLGTWKKWATNSQVEFLVLA